MPELAEVEFYRRKWGCGIGSRITRVHIQSKKRLFRGIDAMAMARVLGGATLISSEAHGKQMMFRFSGNVWLGIHLGMTGELRVESADYAPGKHDHLVLFQRERALVFEDARQFGRVLCFQGGGQPVWWKGLPPTITSPNFTLARLEDRLARHRTLPIKAALLNQVSFPGIGNWMADEILWQAQIRPRAPAGSLSSKQAAALFRKTRFVAQRAIATISAPSNRHDFGDPPRGWLFHERWSRRGKCPRHGTPLKHETIGGRTTAWCPRCQKIPPVA